MKDWQRKQDEAFGLRDDEHMTHAQWKAQEEIDAIETAEHFEREHRFRAEEYLRDAAAADTHSSDVDPGRIDPWAER